MCSSDLHLIQRRELARYASCSQLDHAQQKSQGDFRHFFFKLSGSTRMTSRLRSRYGKVPLEQIMRPNVANGAQ